MSNISILAPSSIFFINFKGCEFSIFIDKIEVLNFEMLIASALTFFRLSNFWWIKRTLKAISTMKNSFAQWWPINAKFLKACTLPFPTLLLELNYLKPSDPLFCIKSKVQNQWIILKLCHSSGNQLEQTVAFMYTCFTFVSIQILV